MKEEAIEKAWLSILSKENYDKVKSIITEDGYLSSTVFDLGTLDINDKLRLLHHCDIENGHWSVFYLPSVLRGIEFNNGWSIIDNQPLSPGYYKWYNIHTNEYIVGDISNQSKYTHYQRIDMDDKPVY